MLSSGCGVLSAAEVLCDFLYYIIQVNDVSYYNKILWFPAAAARSARGRARFAVSCRRLEARNYLIARRFLASGGNFAPDGRDSPVRLPDNPPVLSLRR